MLTGRSDQAIAQELVVTLDTVKKHVSHVLGKLGAASRTEVRKVECPQHGLPAPPTVASAWR
jgi:DNA-binding NarL/FixJ family response regulator